MFKGAIAAIPTPFNDYGRIDEESLRRLIEFQIVNGTQGIVPCGTTGESPTLSFGEHKRVVQIAVEEVRGRVPVIAGTGSNNTAEAVCLTQHAKNAGADGALIIAPYYNKPSQEGLFQHYKSIAEAVDIPIILYNIQGRTAVNIEPVTVSRLAEIENIVGIKEASGSMKQALEIISRCGEDFILLSGEDYLTYPLMCIGGKGVISVVSNIAPREMSDICELCLEGKFAEAKKLYFKLLPICHLLFIETNPAPVKMALKMIGIIDSDKLRLPLVRMSDAKCQWLRDELVSYGFLI